MAFKGTVHRGTPVNYIGPKGALVGNREGYGAARPAGMAKTVHPQYESDQRGYQSDPRSGTPYNSDLGNPDEACRVAEGTGRYGVAQVEGGQDHNDYRSNGAGVVFDGANDYQRGYQPRPQPMLDGPVPRNAPVLDNGFIHREDAAHAGKGNERTANPVVVKVGGVMSRGMAGSSHPDAGESELTRDDDLRARNGVMSR